MSPMMLNLLLQLATNLNRGHGYVILLPLPHSNDLHPVDSTIYMNWFEQSDDPPGWYRAEYFQDGSCKLVYDHNSNVSVFEIVDLNSVE